MNPLKLILNQTINRGQILSKEMECANVKTITYHLWEINSHKPFVVSLKWHNHNLKHSVEADAAKNSRNWSTFYTSTQNMAKEGKIPSNIYIGYLFDILYTNI